MNKTIKSFRELFIKIASKTIIDIILSFPLMLLWNWLVTDLFGIKKIYLIQAFGLLMLVKFLNGKKSE